MIKTEKFKQHSLDRLSPIPLYFQLKKILVDMVDHEYLSPGEMIPSELELCSIYNISRTTIRQALSELVEEGTFYRVKGRGTFVCHFKIHHNLLQKKILLEDDLSNKGFLPSTKLLHLNTMVASHDVANYLSLPLGTDVIYIKQIKYANESPFLIRNAFLPYSLCKSIYEIDLTEETLTKFLTKDPSTKIHSSKYFIQAATPTRDDCKLLTISKTTGIQVINSIGFNKFDCPILYTHSRYRGDKNIFNLEV